MAYIHHQQYWIVRNLNHLRLFPSSHGDIFNVERIGTEIKSKIMQIMHDIFMQTFILQAFLKQ